MDARSLKLLVVVLAVSTVVFGGLYLLNRHVGPGDGGDQGAYVKDACHGWVKDRLKAPASAKFSGENTTRDGQTYVVTGAVDSQNAFGVPIRNNYECTATHSGDATRLVSIVGLDN